MRKILTFLLITLLTTSIFAQNSRRVYRRKALTTVDSLTATLIKVDSLIERTSGHGVSIGSNLQTWQDVTINQEVGETFMVDGDVIIRDTGDLGSESFADGSDFSQATWTAGAEFTVAATDVVYLYVATGAGLLTQTSGNMTIAGVGSRWYKLVYTISGSNVVNASAAITATFASALTYLDLTDGAHTKYFQSAAAPANFVIAVGSATAGETFEIESMSLKEIQGGDLVVHGLITGGGTAGIKVLSDGKVGIGTVNPTETFHIYSSNNSRIAIDVGAGSAATLRFKEDGTDRAFYSYNSGTNFLQFGTQEAGAQLLFYAGANVEALRIDTDGNVGINTTAPSEIVDIEKAGTVKTNTNLLELTNSGNAADMDLTETSILFNQWYYDVTTPAVATSAQITIETEQDWTSTASTQDSRIILRPYQNGAAVDRMTINSNGIVGISQLNSVGEVKCPLIRARAEALHIISADGTDRWMDFIDGGNVGIGTTVPATKLDQAQFSADALGSGHTFSKSRHATAGSHTVVADDDVIGFTNYAPSDGTDFGTISAKIHAEVDDAAPTGSSIGGALVFSTAIGVGADDLTERMRIGADGNVKFAANSTIHSGNSSTGIKFSGSGNTVGLTSFGDISLNIYDGGAYTNAITVKATSKNVGIGTTAPATKFEQAQFSADALGSGHTFSKSRHATAGSHTVVVDDDVIGFTNYAPSDGTDFGTISARIHAEVDDAAPTGSSIGGAWVVSTARGSGADDLTETARFTASGNLDVAGTITGNVFINESAIVGLNTGDGTDADQNLITINRSSLDHTITWDESDSEIEISVALAVAGILSGETGVTLDVDPTITLTAPMCKNAARFNNDADVIDYTLPAAEAGLVVLFYDIGGGVITIDPFDGTDTIYLNGTSVGAGDAIDSPGNIGDFIALMAIDDTRWISLGRNGTFVDGGVD